LVLLTAYKIICCTCLSIISGDNDKVELEEVDAEVEEETDEELEELARQISFLNMYIPTIDDDELKKIFVRRLDTLQFMYSVRS
jgi:hypothetical protein